MQSIEAVVVGERDVGIVVDEKRQHVVPLLRNGVVQRRISFRVLNIQQKNATMIKGWSSSPTIQISRLFTPLFDVIFCFLIAECKSILADISSRRRTRLRK